MGRDFDFLWSKRGGPATTPCLCWEGDSTARCASQALSTPPAEDQTQSVNNAKRWNTQTLTVKNTEADIRENQNETQPLAPSLCKCWWLLNSEISIRGNARSPLLCRLHRSLESADFLLWRAVTLVGDLKLEAAQISQYHILQQSTRKGCRHASWNWECTSPGKEGLAGWPMRLLKHFNFFFPLDKNEALGNQCRLKVLLLRVCLSSFSTLYNSETWWLTSLAID